MPHINPVVDLGNAVSLKYTLPMSAHDLDGSSEDICIRLVQPGDTFLPFGCEAEEMPDICSRTSGVYPPLNLAAERTR